MSTKTLVILFIVILISTPAIWFLLRKNADLSGIGDLITTTSPTSSPTTTPEASVSPGEKNIIVFSPKPGDKVESPLTVKGRARVFENTFAYILKDAKGNEIYKDHAMANAPDVGQYGDFEVKIPIPLQAGGSEVTLEVFDYSAKDGSVENLVSIPLQVITKESMEINVYFTNNKLDPAVSCTKVFPIKKQILKTREVAFMSLFELIQGPNMAELGEGYDTSISGQTGINSVTIKNGTAYVDFDENLEYGIAGSCKVTAIRSQVEATLKQFSSIKNVVISVNGRTEDILQP